MISSKFYFVILAIALTGGCAFTDSTLPVEFDETHATRGPISNMDSMSFNIDSFTDGRDDQDRIGYKRNGYGQKTADITTEQAVTEIVAEALSDAIKHNGHSTANPADIMVAGNVDTFWLDMDVNFLTIRFLGTISCEITLLDGSSREVIYRNSYQGHYEKETAAGMEGTWTEVMALALENLIDSIIKDPEMASVLRQR